MFQQMKRLATYIRFEFAFRNYERSEKKARLAKAELEYSTVRLEEEIVQVNSQIEQEIKAQYATRRIQYVNNISDIKIELSQIELQLSILQRNYKSELQPIYDEFDEIKDDLQILYEAKKDAYDDLNTAKSLISSWYARSEGVFFKNKKQIPQKSFFGQTQDELVSYKRRRDSAHYEIKTLSEKIAHLKSEKEDLRSSLVAIKQDRDVMYTLRNAGFNSKTLTVEAGHKRSLLENTQIALKSLETEVLIATSQKQIQYGLIERREKIQSLINQKADFVASFSTDRARLKRRALLKRNQKADEQEDG